MPQPCPSLPPGSDGKDPGRGPGKAPQHPRASLFLRCSMTGLSAGSGPSWPLPVITKVIIDVFSTISSSPHPIPAVSDPVAFRSRFLWQERAVLGSGSGMKQLLGVPRLVLGLDASGSAWRCPSSCSSPSGWRIHQESLDCSCFQENPCNPPFRLCHQ